MYVGGDPTTIDQLVCDYRDHPGIRNVEAMNRLTPSPAPGSTDPVAPCPDVGEPIK